MCPFAGADGFRPKSDELSLQGQFAYLNVVLLPELLYPEPDFSICLCETGPVRIALFHFLEIHGSAQLCLFPDPLLNLPLSAARK